MRDLMVMCLLPILLILSVRNTFSAYLMWGWSGLIALSTYLYGFMAGVPYVQTFAIIALALILLGKDPEKIAFKSNRTIIIMLIFAMHIVLSATFAAPGLARNWEMCSNLLKTILYCLLMPMVVTSRLRIHAMVVMIALAISFNAGLDGLKFISSAGAHTARGNSKLGDNNHYAMVIIMVLPLLLYLYQYTSKKLIRWGFIAVLVVSSLAVVATASRGGFVGMMVLASWIVLKSRRKLQGFIVIALVAALIIQMAPESWSNRMNTIEGASDDASFMGRVTAWKRASAIALENPVFGAGFHAGQAPSLFQEFRHKSGLLGFIETPDINYPAASHRIYFEVMSDLGFLGLFIFLALIANAFITRQEIKKLVKHGGCASDWAVDIADMLAGALIVYLVSGALLSAAYFDLPYIFIMLMEVVKLQLVRAQNSKVNAVDVFSPSRSVT